MPNTFSNGTVDANVEHAEGFESNTGLPQIGGNARDDSVRQLGAGKGVADINPASLTHGGTHAEGVSYFQYPMGSMLLTADSNPGTVLFRIPLDWSIDNNLNSGVPQWMQYRLENVRVSFTSLAPLGTSSGGVTIGSNPDPSNPAGNDDAKALMLMNTLTGSTVINPKTDSHVDFKEADNNWKWVKKAGVPRLESYGEVVAIVRLPSAVQTVGQWSINVSGSIRYRGKTVQTAAFPAISYQSHTFVDVDNVGFSNSPGNYFLAFPVPATSPIGAKIMTTTSVVYHAVFTADAGLRSVSTGTVTNLTIRHDSTAKFAVLNVQLSDGADWVLDSFKWVGDYASVVWIVSATVASGELAVPLEALQSSTTPIITSPVKL